MAPVTNDNRKPPPAMGPGAIPSSAAGTVQRACGHFMAHGAKLDGHRPLYVCVSCGKRVYECNAGPKGKTMHAKCWKQPSLFGTGAGS